MEKSLHTLTLGRGISNSFSRNIFELNTLYYKSRGQVIWQGSYFICVWKVKNVSGLAVFSCFDLRQTESFSVTGSFSSGSD